ncbi:MAG: S8 family serine peptidase [Novosphingobium sp.]
MNLRQPLFVLAIAALAAPALAQLGLPAPVLPGLPPVGEVLDGPLRSGGDLLRGTASEVAERLDFVRSERLDRLLRRNRDTLERDAAGEIARRGELLLVDPDAATLSAVGALGFAVAETGNLDGLDIAFLKLRLPAALSLAAAQRLLAERVPNAVVASDQLHFQSGGAPRPSRAAASGGAAGIAVPVGLIDGAGAQPVSGQRGFAKGAPLASSHGSAVISLAQRAGVRRLYVADVYGSDPAGGNALAIAQGLGWLVGQGVRVVSISLVGPRNPLVERAIAAAQRRGVTVVAAVGNDGPAAPPAYPASYPGVIAVSAVDARGRPLIEAGRALHLDYAAPGAGLRAADKKGKWQDVRGTSFAAPLVAARAAAAVAAGGAVTATLDREAQALGRRLPDPQIGRGVVCGACR